MNLFEGAVSPGHALVMALRHGAEVLGEDRAGDAPHLLAHAAGVARDRLRGLDMDAFNQSLSDAYVALLKRRAGGEPVSKILGSRDFWTHRFIVTPDVLDPRPETEILVAAALERPFARLLDLGTGSGAILLSLLAERPAATGLGVDLSPRALAVAGQNRALLGLVDRAALQPSDWFSTVTGQFDLIVSNPPYIALSEMDGLSVEVRAHDPRMALTDEGDGLSCYRILAAGAPAHLAPGGRMLVEIGPTQGLAVCDLLAQAGLTSIAIRQDLDGRDRVVMGEMPL